MNNFTPVLVLHNIKPVNGGLTYSVMLRADVFASMAKKVVVFTYGFDEDYQGSLKYWKEKLVNFSKIEFINVFEDANSEPLISKYVSTTLIPNESRLPDRKNVLGYRVFVDGVYNRYELYSKDGRLASIDHFEAPWTRVSKSVFSKQGARIVEHYMDKVTNKISFSAYYTSSGRPLYSCKYNLETGKASTFFDHINNKEAENLNLLIADWVKDVCQSNKEVVLFLDNRALVEYCAKMPVQKTIFVLHSSHLQSPCDDLSKIDVSMKPVLDNLDYLDNIIVLTKLQQRHLSDVIKDHAHKIKVINHPQFPVEESKQQPIDFHNNIISSIARYHPAKNLSEAIKAFKMVALAVPEAVYNIYGYGPEEQKLKELIKELNLENNVFLKGFTTNVEEVYQNSCATLLTSRYEGQPLVIGESMAYGVPVISYDITYGPSELITDGVDGFLVKKYDTYALAEKILLLLLNKEKRAEMSMNARKISEKLSADKFKQSWLELLD